MQTDTPQSGGSGPPRRLKAGDHAAPFALPDHTGAKITPVDDQTAGRPMLLVFLSGDAPERWVEDLAGFCDAQDEIAALGGLVFGITPCPIQVNGEIHDAHSLKFPLLSDPKGEVFGAYGIDPKSVRRLVTTLLLDRNFRIQRLIVPDPRQSRGATALAALKAAVAGEQPITLGGHPPVLVIPRVLAPEDCARLIEIWHRPVKVWSTDGLVSDGHDEEKGDFKVRNDSYGKVMQFVVRDPAVQTMLDSKIGHRIGRELRKAFQTTVSQREDYRIACYDSAESGSLPAHRDNPTPKTKHRRFTLTVALNGGEYHGGELCFREYGPQRYSVETGTAIIWSAALLHEVSEVTAGRRFILGTHLYGE
jgi:peroxiredoxin/predicted 2-oxoglutarate/Fe(II)-dependent dioxygenase YbiX